MDIFEKFSEIVSQSKYPIVFEFGMCDGYHSNIMLNILSKQNKNFEYHGFEPVKYLFDSINLQSNPKGIIVKNCKAISDKVGFSDFYISSGIKYINGLPVQNYYGSSSIRQPKLVLTAYPEMKFEKTCVETISFDEYIKLNNLENSVIDFVWADIQGAEIDLIKGGKNAFKKVRYFYTEYCDSELYKGEIGLKEICNLLPDFEIVKDYIGDVLFKNKYL